MIKEIKINDIYDYHKSQNQSVGGDPMVMIRHQQDKGNNPSKTSNPSENSNTSENNNHSIFYLTPLFFVLKQPGN